MQEEKPIILNYNSASSLRSFLQSEGLGMRKKYGQNFLLNSGIRHALVNALEAEAGAEVWEIGAGLGAMTALLLEKGLLVRAFEIDCGFSRLLKGLFSGSENFFLVEGDVMKTWPSQKPASYLLGNLPYNIAAALIADLIEKGRLFTRMVVTVQREVALRMYAKAGSADYSSFSVLCSLFYKVKPLMLIRSGSFYPRPNVDSSGVLLERRSEIVSCPDLFFPLLRALFSSRRKTIKNNLSAFIASKFGKPREVTEKICTRLLAEFGLAGNERAEILEPQAFLSLSNLLLEILPDECKHCR
ncbi:MAG: 16S rRNA (adenine(1518)-N(6)/adenine(1519)-N(6))-dimethyltransferase RsmA [Treponema sp.]|nr:16S rRNA (adenine(1518)-N(6)/adenine(1519)-N(6))-dimethyltransferase RsmA [Treponema sp.]